MNLCVYVCMFVRNYEIDISKQKQKTNNQTMNFVRHIQIREKFFLAWMQRRLFANKQINGELNAKNKQRDQFVPRLCDSN